MVTSEVKRQARAGAEVVGAALVAASDAPARVRAVAHYRCDGVADEVQLAAALAAHRVVVCSEGTFTFAESLDDGWRDNSVLTGQQRGTVFRIAGAVPGKHIVNAEGSSGTPLVGVTVSGIRVVGYGDDGGATLDHGIRFKWVNRGRIDDVWAESATFSGVVLSDCEHCTGSNVNIERGALGTNGGWYGLTFENPNKANKSSWHTFSGVTANVIEHAFATNNCDDCTVNGLTSRGTRADYAINLTNSDRIVVNGGSVSDAAGLAFIEQGSTGCKIANLTHQHAAVTWAGYGIYIDASPRTSIVNVDLDMTGQLSGSAAIRVNNSPYTSISGGSVLEAFGNGLQIETNSDGTKVNGVQVTGAGAAGIKVAATPRASVTGCTVVGSATHGIQYDGVRGSVTGNTCGGNGGDGIRLEFADDTAVTGNACDTNTGYGINIAAANAERNVITGNTLRSNTAGSLNRTTGQSAGNENLVRGNKGYATEAAGLSTQTPGAVATVNIPHGLATTPNSFSVQPADADARGAPAFSVTADGTNLILAFASNLTAATAYEWRWQANVI